MHAGFLGWKPRRQCLTARCACQGHAAEDPDNQCGCSCEAVQDPGAAVTGWTHAVCSKFDFVPSCCADARIENAIRAYAAQAAYAQVTEECQPSWEVSVLVSFSLLTAADIISTHACVPYTPGVLWRVRRGLRLRITPGATLHVSSDSPPSL